ncbi:MAG: type II toxin-antitoxin system prevent-host-death family antitoxin [Chloroflexi bacterium]|nr:type II toxin-antitoxin system prevent-host-death family antitoxin [Chloroflexota bacterium]
MGETAVSIRELKARLSRYMRQVKAGGTVVITERGKPIARSVPMRPSREERVQDLVQAGLVSWSGRKLGPLASVAETKGDRTIAEMLLEDRE